MSASAGSVLEAPLSGAHSYIRTLDGVRGLAILLVLCCHLEFMGDITGNSTLMRAIRAVMFCGWAGVDLFFVLSGFLITGILLDTKDSPNRERSFYVRRILRIFPLYYLAVLGMMGIAPYFPALRPLYPSSVGWLSHLLFLQNWYMPLREPNHGILGHFWSLGVEEQFYLIWPWCVWFLPHRYLIRACALGCLTALLLRCVLVQGHSGSAVILMNTVTRADTLLCGAFCAIVVRNTHLLGTVKPLLAPVLAATAAGMVLIEVVAHEVWTRSYFTQSIGFSLLASGFGALVIAAYLQNGTGTLFDRCLSSRPLVIFGKYSYGIYVYHGIVFFVGNQLFRQRGWLFALLLVLASLLVAAVSFHLFEVKFLRLKRFFEPARSPATQARRAALPPNTETR